MMRCFTPILAFAVLACIKLILFSVKNGLASLAIIVSLASMVFAFESHFDNERYNAPLFVVAIPFGIILLAFTFETLFEIRYEEDYGSYVFKGYDFTHKRIMAVFNAVITVCYVVSETVALYALE